MFVLYHTGLQLAQALVGRYNFIYKAWAGCFRV
jgi:hypothetical protein